MCDVIAWTGLGGLGQGSPTESGPCQIWERANLWLLCRLSRQKPSWRLLRSVSGRAAIWVTGAAALLQTRRRSIERGPTTSPLLMLECLFDSEHLRVSSSEKA